MSTELSCPDCGRKKASDLESILAGGCPRWSDKPKPAAFHDCAEARKRHAPAQVTAQALADRDPYYAARYNALYNRPRHDGDAPSERARS